MLINNLALLPVYGCVWQGLVTTEFTNLIGWNWNKPRSRFSYLDWIQFALKFETKIKKCSLFSFIFLWNHLWKWQKIKDDDQFSAGLS